MTKIKKAMVVPPMAFRMMFLSFYPFLKTTGAGFEPRQKKGEAQQVHQTIRPLFFVSNRHFRKPFKKTAGA
jgi:hypothetical protein